MVLIKIRENERSYIKKINQDKILYLDIYIDQHKTKLKKILLKQILNYEKFILKNFNKMQVLKSNLYDFSSIFNPDINSKNSDHYLLLQIISIKYFLKKNSFSNIKIIIEDKRKYYFFKKFFKKCEVQFEKKESKNNKLINIIYSFNLFYKFLKIFVSIFLKINFKTTQSTQQSFKHNIFIDAFTHFNKEQILTGSFQSNYWTKLYDHFKKNKNSTWLHFYYPNHITPSMNIARSQISNINKKEKYLKHFLLNDFFTLSDFFSLLLLFLNNLRKLPLTYYNILKLKKKNEFFNLFEKNFINSLFGIKAIDTLYYLILLNKVVKKIDTKSKITYLYENQCWERALKDFCFQNKIDNFGFPHAGIRFWDLRYFLIPSVYLKKSNFNFYLYHSKDTNIFLTQIFKHNLKLKKVESLRYYNLVDNYFLLKKNNKKKNILLFLDITEQKTSKILDLLKFQKKNFNKIYFKCHPTISPIELAKKYKFASPFEYTKHKFNFVITDNNTTSIYVPCYLKTDFLVYKKNNFFNLCPLLGINDNTKYFHDSNELSNLLKKKNYFKFDKDFHILNNDVVNWKKLLKI